VLKLQWSPNWLQLINSSQKFFQSTLNVAHALIKVSAQNVNRLD